MTIDWPTVTQHELDALQSVDQQRAVALAAHGVSQRTAATLLGISRAAYRSRLEAAAHHILKARRHAA